MGARTDSRIVIETMGAGLTAPPAFWQAHIENPADEKVYSGPGFCRTPAEALDAMFSKMISEVIADRKAGT